MNTVSRDKITYQYESFWRATKEDNTRDSQGKRFPWPGSHSQPWGSRDQFLNKLVGVQNYLKSKDRFSDGVGDRNRDCLLCDAKNITTGTFNLNNVIWEDGLTHYITVHNVKPSQDFVDTIYRFNPSARSLGRTPVRLGADVYTINNMKYLKLERNQIMIMDALMAHGGYTRKYIDAKDKNVYRYSEHAGLLDFNDQGLEKIIISGKTNRVDKGDDDIYLPKNIPEAFDYEYIFHTHPPTPKPGGRVKLGILYEFPSISDIFHFIDHFNGGQTQGSLVITPEGLYNIRKLVFDRKKIKINEDRMYDDMRNIMRDAQSKAIEKYGTEFTPHDFYSKISQDKEYINMLNSVLNKYKMHIDYYSRERDDRGKWIIDTLYVPIYVVEHE